MAFGAGVGGGIGTLSATSAVELIIGLLLFDDGSSGGGRFFSFFVFFAGRVSMEKFCSIYPSTRVSLSTRLSISQFGYNLPLPKTD